MQLAGSVVAVSSSPTHGFSKAAKDRIVLVAGSGVEGDAHAGPYVRHRYLARRSPRLPNLRQVHLIASELLEELKGTGYEVHPGDLGENVTTAGIDLTCLPSGALIRLGETAIVELTGLRTPCVLIDRFRKGLKKAMISDRAGEPKFRCGVLGVFANGGTVAAGDKATVELPTQP